MQKMIIKQIIDYAEGRLSEEGGYGSVDPSARSPGRPGVGGVLFGE